MGRSLYDKLCLPELFGELNLINTVKLKPRLFLTAGHCVGNFGNPVAAELVKSEFRPGQKIGIMQGTNTIESPSKLYSVTVESVTIHRDWSTTPFDLNDAKLHAITDLAVVVVSENTDIPVAKIDFSVVKEKTKIALAGYGCESDLLSPDLESTEKYRFRWMKNIVKDVESFTFRTAALDASENKARGCPGASGSPVYRDTGEKAFNTVVGIATYVDSDDKSYHTGYARLDSLTPNNVKSWLDAAFNGKGEAGSSPNASYKVFDNRILCSQETQYRMACPVGKIDACRPFPARSDHHECVPYDSSSPLIIRPEDQVVEVVSPSFGHLRMIARPNVPADFQDSYRESHRLCFDARGITGPTSSITADDVLKSLNGSPKFIKAFETIVFRNNFALKSFNSIEFRDGGDRMVLTFTVSVVTAGAAFPGADIRLEKCF